jgi:hypothetical protein
MLQKYETDKVAALRKFPAVFLVPVSANNGIALSTENNKTFMDRNVLQHRCHSTNFRLFTSCVTIITSINSFSTKENRHFHYADQVTACLFQNLTENVAWSSVLQLRSYSESLYANF